MNIKPSVYESLTVRQRVIATIEAEARGDDDEVLRLRDTCPKYTYRQADAEYSHAMLRIVVHSVAVESDIRGNIIGACMAMLMDHDEALQKFLQNIANIRAAWCAVMQERGIEPDVMKKFSPPTHFSADLIYDLLPKPDEKAVGVIAEGMREFLMECN